MLELPPSPTGCVGPAPRAAAPGLPVVVPPPGVATPAVFKGVALAVGAEPAPPEDGTGPAAGFFVAADPPAPFGIGAVPGR